MFAMHFRLTVLAILVASAHPANAAEPDSVYDIPTHVACLRAPTPKCLVDLALENAMLGISREQPYDMRRVIGMAQLHTGRTQDAIHTLRQVAAEKAINGYSSPNPYLVDDYVAIALAEHAAGNTRAADIAFADALRNTGPARQGYDNDTWFSSLLRVSIAQAETGRLDAAEKALAEARQLAQGLKTDPYSGNIWARQEFIGTLQAALATLATARVAANDLDGALAAARQIGDPAFMQLAGMADRSPTEKAGGKGSTFEFMAALSGIENAGVDPDVDVILSLVDLASVLIDRGDNEGARQTLGRARTLMADLDDPSFGLANALGRVAPIQVRLGDLPAALETTERIRQLCCTDSVKTVHNPSHYAQTLHEIAMVQLVAGDIDAAVKTAEGIELPYYRIPTFSAIAKRAIADKRADAVAMVAAVETAVHSTQGGANFEPLTQLAVLKSLLGETAAAHKLFQEALQAAKYASSGSDIMYSGDDTKYSVEGATRSVIAGMAETGDIAGALDVARRERGIWVGAFRDIANGQLDRDDLDGAEATLLEGYRRYSERYRQYRLGEAPAPDGSTAQPALMLDDSGVAVLGRLAILRAESGKIDLARQAVDLAFQGIAPFESQRTTNQYADHYARLSWVKALATIAQVQSRIGDIDAAKGTFAQASSAARLIGYLRDRIATVLFVTKAMAQAGLVDEARALLAIARQDTEELANNLRPRWVGMDSVEARTMFRLIAIQQAELGDMPAAFETVSAIVDPSVLARIGGYVRTFQLAREASLREVAAGLTKAGRIDDAMRVSDELSISFLRAGVLADVAAVSTNGAAGMSPQDLIDEASRLLEQTDSNLSQHKVVSGRSAAYASLAVSQQAIGDATAGRALLAKAHALAKQLPDPAQQIGTLLVIADAEHAVGDQAAAIRSIGVALALADQGLSYDGRLDAYAEIALSQARIEGQAAAIETVRRMFGFYYTALGGTGGTMKESVRFPVTIAELMARLGIERLESTAFPPQKQ